MPNGTSQSESFKLSLQYSSGGSVSYDAIAEGIAAKGAWTKLSNASYKIPAGATDLQFYIETVDSTSDFYVDDVIVTGSASAAVSAPVTPTPAKKIIGDVNGDGFIDTFDMIRIRQLAVSSDVTTAQMKLADINGDKDIDGLDTSALIEDQLGKKDVK